jgi:hypothetical protein
MLHYVKRARDACRAPTLPAASLTASSSFACSARFFGKKVHDDEIGKKRKRRPLKRSERKAALVWMFIGKIS